MLSPSQSPVKNLLFNGLVSVRCDKAFDTLTASERQEHVSNKAAKLRKEKKNEAESETQQCPKLKHFMPT